MRRPLAVRPEADAVIGDDDDERVLVQPGLLEPVEHAPESEVGVADLEEMALLRLDRQLGIAHPAFVHEAGLEAEVGRVELPVG